MFVVQRPPLRGGSRAEGGGESPRNSECFGLWQGSLPPPLRGTSLAEGGFKSQLLFYTHGMYQIHTTPGISPHTNPHPHQT